MLYQIATGLWGIDYGVRMPLMTLPTRSTVVRLRGNQLAIISPGPLGAHEHGALSGIGTVEYLIAPNLFHHLHLPAAVATYPQAAVFAPEGLAAKNKQLRGMTLNPMSALSPIAGDELLSMQVDGVPKLAETVFLHVPSRSLIITDLAFNIEQPRGLGTYLVFNAFGTYRRFRTSRLISMLAKDRAAATASARAILNWDFERVVVSHGDIVQDNAKERMREALAPLLL